MEKQEITIYDVAREAQVSMATVSRVVNGNKNVRDDTRNKVLEVIKRLNYQPNAVARGLASKKSTTIGLIVPELNNLYFSELSKGIDDIATMYKYNIIITSVDTSVNREEEVIQGLLSKQVDGVIYMANELSEIARKAFERNRTPVVLAGTVDHDKTLPSVNIDYQAAIKQGITSFLADGKKHPALVLGRADVEINAAHRIKAFKDALTDAGLAFNDSDIYENNFGYEDGYQVFEKLQANGVDSVLVTRDVVAAGVVNAAVDANVKIPEDFEVISASNTIISKIIRPSITSIKQPLYDIGAVSMRLLTKMINREELDEAHIVLPFTIENRQSTK